MRRHLHGLFLSALLVAGSSGHAGADCAGPAPEAARMITPPLTAVPPGSGFVLAGSEAVSTSITLTGPETVVLVGTEIVPNLLRFTLPGTITPGRYGIAASYRGVVGPVGELEVTTTAPALAPPTEGPAGVLARTEHEGRWGPSAGVTLTLDAPTSRAVAVAFEWTVSGHRFGSSTWVNAQTSTAMLGNSSSCGGFPFGVTLPGRGARVRAAFVDERGQLGPWRTLRVR